MSARIGRSSCSVPFSPRRHRAQTPRPDTPPRHPRPDTPPRHPAQTPRPDWPAETPSAETPPQPPRYIHTNADAVLVPGSRPHVRCPRRHPRPQPGAGRRRRGGTRAATRSPASCRNATSCTPCASRPRSHARRVVFDQQCSCGIAGCAHLAAAAFAALDRFPALRRPEQQSFLDALTTAPPAERTPANRVRTGSRRGAARLHRHHAADRRTDRHRLPDDAA